MLQKLAIYSVSVFDSLFLGMVILTTRLSHNIRTDLAYFSPYNAIMNTDLSQFMPTFIGKSSIAYYVWRNVVFFANYPQQHHTFTSERLKERNDLDDQIWNNNSHKTYNANHYLPFVLFPCSVTSSHSYRQHPHILLPQQQWCVTFLPQFHWFHCVCRSSSQHSLSRATAHMTLCMRGREF